LDIVVGGGIEQTSIPPPGRGDSTGVPLDRNPVLDIDPRDASRSANGSDAPSNGIEARFGAADQVHAPRRPRGRKPALRQIRSLRPLRR
jgi:hypothetical protein